MRATRQTELSGQFPLHVVCDWLGNSAPIAQKHYLQVTEQHFAEAISGGAKSGALSAKRGAQNQAQHSHGTLSQPPAKNKNSPEKPGCFANRCDPQRVAATTPSTP